MQTPTIQKVATPRLVLTAAAGVWLVDDDLQKALHHHEGMYTHGAGYAFYGGRWHKVGADKPAPKGAPVAAHPEAGGAHVGKHHFGDAEWAAMKLPDSNVNAGPFNKALLKLREWSDAGNVTAILGAGYGTNTYGKKLATIANHILGLYGSPHKVAAGQKAGDHGAVLSPDAPSAHPSGLPANLAPKTAAEPAAAPKKLVVVSKVGKPLKVEGASAKAGGFGANAAGVAAFPANPSVVAQMLGLPASALTGMTNTIYGVTDTHGRTFDVLKNGGAMVVAASGKNKDLTSVHSMIEFIESMPESMPEKVIKASSLEGKPAYDHLAQAKKAGKLPGAASKEWLADNPGGQSELDSALKELGFNKKPADADNDGYENAKPDDKKTVGSDATIHTSSSNGVDGSTWFVFSVDSKEKGVNIGALQASSKKGSGTMSIREAKVGDDHKGSGFGKALYVAALEKAKELGLGLTSDNAISADADHVWASLKKAGHKVVRAASVQEISGKLYAMETVKTMSGAMLVPSGKPVWSTAGAAVALGAGAPEPVGGFSSALELSKQIKPSKNAAADEIDNALFSNYDDKFVIKDDAGKVVAAIAFGVNETPGDKSIEVHHIGSASPGAGTKLLNLAKAEAKKQGLPIKLYATSDAIGFYKKSGFTPAAGAPKATADGGLLMEFGGPKEGDTKPGANGGTLVLKDGHWVLQGKPAAAVGPITAAQVEGFHKWLAAGQPKTNKAGSWASQWATLSPTQKKLIKDALPPAPPPATPAPPPAVPTDGSTLSPKVKGMIDDAVDGGDHEYAFIQFGPHSNMQPAVMAYAKTKLEAVGYKMGEPDPGIKEIYSFDSGFTAMNSGSWVLYNTTGSGHDKLLHFHKVGTKMAGANLQVVHLDTMRLAIAKGTAKKAGLSPKAAPPHAPPPAPPAAATTSAPVKKSAGGVLSAQALGNLQSINWVKLELPTSNTNAASVNKKLAAIKAAAFAGDVKALEAMKFGSNTYGKKLALAAQTAIAGLGGDATAAVAVKPQADAKPKEISAAGKATVDAMTMESLESIKDLPGLDPVVSAYVNVKYKELSAAKANEATGAKIEANDLKILAEAAADEDVTIIKQLVLHGSTAKVKEKAAAALKRLGDKPVTVAAAKTTMTNTMPGHNKSWSVYCAENAKGNFDLVTEYGKIGGTQQKSVKEFPTSGTAQKAMGKLIDQKINGGYSNKKTDWLHTVQIQKPSAAPAPASNPNSDKKPDVGGPKEGDTKMGADGLLMLKDGHWVKVDGKTAFVHPSGWAFDPSDMGFSGYPTLMGDGFYIAVSDTGAEMAAISDEGEVDDGGAIHGTLEEVLQNAKDDGLPLPPDELNNLLLNIAKKNGWGDSAGHGGLPKFDMDPIAGWSAAVKTGFSPTGAQAQAMEDLQASNEDEYMDVMTGAVASFMPANLLELDDDAYDKAMTAATNHVHALHRKGLNAAGKNKKPAAPAPDPVKPDAQKTEPDSVESMDAWKKTGPQAGSNAGGKFMDANGQEWYCKFPASADIAKSEILAAKLYRAAGLSSQDAKLVTQGGKVGIATKWETIKKASSATALAKVDGVLSGFAVDAWLGNWDVVGMGLDNLQIGADGKAHRVDAGGSLEYRAQGAKKPFGSTVDEITTLRDKKMNPHSAAVFGKMKDADILASVAKVAAIEDSAIRAIVHDFGPGTDAEKKAMAETLIARKKDLLSKYPAAAKPKKKALDPTALPIDPTKVPKPHDFANWNGPGKGLSSKAFVNKANADAEDGVFKLTKAGNMVAVKAFKFAETNKETGVPTGQMIPIAQHPSKHVQQYQQDMLQLLDEIANPPEPLKVFRSTEVGSLGSLSAAFPPKKFGTTVAKVASNEKLGFWVALGAVGGVDKFKPKVLKNFSVAAIQAAKAKHDKASSLAKHFISRVQASGSYNDLFRDGKTHDLQGNALTDVAKAALAHATEQPEGTCLYRWQKMTPQMLEHIMSAKDGTVFQATGSMCTSYDPTGTSHFGSHRVKVVYAKGAKAVDSFASGSFKGEKEVTTLPNSRFVILSKKMVPDVEHGKPGSTRLELEVLMLPPDLGIQ